jgi:hypothetical protein
MTAERRPRVSALPAFGYDWSHRYFPFLHGGRLALPVPSLENNWEQIPADRPVHGNGGIAFCSAPVSTLLLPGHRYK